MGTKEHRKHTPQNLDLGVISVSSSRSLEEDQSGHWIAKRARREGHQVVHHSVIPDHTATITATAFELLRTVPPPHVLIFSGGTGISPQDVTIEALQPYFSKELTAFGVLFSQLSFEKVDSAAILSRSTAGVIGKTLVFCLPGSLKACKLACSELIFPELGHLVKHLGEN